MFWFCLCICTCDFLIMSITNLRNIQPTFLTTLLWCSLIAFFCYFLPTYLRNIITRLCYLPSLNTLAYICFITILSFYNIKRKVNNEKNTFSNILGNLLYSVAASGLSFYMILVPSSLFTTLFLCRSFFSDSVAAAGLDSFTSPIHCWSYFQLILYFCLVSSATLVPWD